MNSTSLTAEGILDSTLTMIALIRITGLIVATIGMQMALDGIADFISS